MPPVLNSAKIQTALTVVEMLDDVPASAAQVTSNAYNNQTTLTPTSTPPASVHGFYEQVIAGGGYDIDLTALAGLQGAVSATGKRLQAILIDVPVGSVGSVTVDAGASNGYELNGTSPLQCEIGGSLVKRFNDNGVVDVDATHKILRVAGTNGDTPRVQIVMG